MPTVVNTDTSAAKNSTSSISFSRTMRARRRDRRWLGTEASITLVASPGTADIRRTREFY